MNKKTLIVEDHPIVTESLIRMISDTFYDMTCVHAATAGKGLAYLNGNHFDLVLLDINLPDMSGIDFCTEAISRFPGLKILAITSMTQRHIVEKTLQAGALGFVLKTSDTKDITEGIRQVIEGRPYLGTGVRELIQKKSSGSAGVPVITRRESEILRLIADGNTNQEIADRLFISTFTVDSHRKNLLLKLGVKNTAQLIRSATSLGII
jgi:DNA-binding NarL/FixJ family response regulator